MKNYKKYRNKLGITTSMVSAFMLICIGFLGCKDETVYVDRIVEKEVEKQSDTLAPAAVTNLVATAKESRVLLTWTDAADTDIYGYEISYSGKQAINRAITSLDKTSMIAPQGAGGCYVSGLTNGTEYTFTVKTVDTSGNKSIGVTAKATPESVCAANAMQIVLSTSVPHENAYTGNKSNTKVTITANITTASNVKKVVWKKNGSLIAKTLLADTEVNTATVTTNNAIWTFDITATDETANGNYTVAAIDEAGREEAEQIVIDNFDFTPPKRVQIENAVYSSELSAIILNWSEPSAEDYDHVLITYTINNGTEDSEPSEPVTVAKETASKTFTGIDGNAGYYTYSLVSVDALGNKSDERFYMVSVKKVVKNIPDGFVKVKGTTITGNETWTPSSEIFVRERSLVIPDLIVCDHEVTRGEYKAVIGTDPSTANAYDKDGNLLTGDDVLNNPVNNVNWYNALVYCNKLSIAEKLTPCYSISDTPDPDKWGKISYNYNNDTWDNVICDFKANGYRLPTEAEWEWLARGGENYTYSGSNVFEDVGWSIGETHDIKTKQANAYGLYDMSGNVYEWCWDWSGSINSATDATGSSASGWRVLRGLDYRGTGPVNYRWSQPPYSLYYDNVLGFRVVRND